MQTVLIADGDLGFVFWLGHRLGNLGHQALPALNLAQAATLAEEFDFNVLVIDPSLPDAASFVNSLRRSHRSLKVLSLLADPEERLEQLSDLEKALQDAPVQSKLLHEASRNGLGDYRELITGNRLAPSRAALVGILVGAALWTVLIVLVAPR